LFVLFCLLPDQVEEARAFLEAAKERSKSAKKDKKDKKEKKEKKHKKDKKHKH
jgi:hypothetical protein